MASILDFTAWAFGNDYSGAGDWLNRGTGGSTHDGVITGATYTDAGADDYFDFDGANDEIVLGGSAGLNVGSGDFTIGICFAVDVLTSDQMLIYKTDEGASTGWKIWMNDPADVWAAVCEDDPQPFRAVVGNAADTDKTTLILVRDGDDLELWEDGVSVASTNGLDTTPDDYDNNVQVHMGLDAADGQDLNGRIFSYGIYVGTALADGEIGTGTNTLHDNLLNQTTPESPLGAPEGWGFLRMGFGWLAIRPRLLRPEGLLTREQLVVPRLVSA